MQKPRRKMVLHWWTEGDSEDTYLERIHELRKKYVDHPRLQQHVSTVAAISAIADDLKHEGTEPACPDLLAELRVAFTDAHAGGSEQEIVAWRADGTSPDGAATHAQLVQHVRAWKYLWELPEDQPLSQQTIVEAHRILMSGATVASGKAIAGIFRDVPAWAYGRNFNQDVFVDPSDIEPRLQQVLAKLTPSDLGSIGIFLERFLYVHPFIDGNGRLARLLVSRCLKVYGLPIPLSINAQAKKKRNKFYYEALLRAREGRGYDDLRLLLLDSVYLAWRGFENRVGEEPQPAKRARRKV